MYIYFKRGLKYGLLILLLFILAIFLMRGMSEPISIYVGSAIITTKTPEPVQILLYKSFYDEPLFPEFDWFHQNCKGKSEFSIKRSNNIEYFDVAILHFISLIEFAQKYLETPFSKTGKRRIVIVLSLEPVYFNRLFMSELANFDKYFYYWTVNYRGAAYFVFRFGRHFPRESEHNVSALERQFKTRSVAASIFVSNCVEGVNIRINYTKTLSEYFSVVKNGRCFGKRISYEERKMQMEKNMFVLAFENQVCEGYETEKYWQSVKYGAIPIVFQYSANENWMIKGSFIDVFDFESPEKLAGYLKYVSQNFTEYSKYFEWKAHQSVEEGFIPLDTCGVAERIKKAMNTHIEVDPNIYSLINSSTCLRPEEIKMRLAKRSIHFTQ